MCTKRLVQIFSFISSLYVSFSRDNSCARLALQEAYQAYENHQNNAPVAVLRDALSLEPAGPEVDLDEVEPAENIMKRFCTGGMSLGAISRETHETISIAMNRINGQLLQACLCFML